VSWDIGSIVQVDLTDSMLSKMQVQKNVEREMVSGEQALK
jgi:hypothetical protein